MIHKKQDFLKKRHFYSDGIVLSEFSHRENSKFSDKIIKIKNYTIFFPLSSILCISYGKII